MSRTLALKITAISIGLLISLPLTAALARIGNRLGAMDSAGAEGHDKVLRPIPNIGGIAIYAAVALPMAVGRLQALMMELAPGEPLMSRDNLAAMSVDNVMRLSDILPPSYNIFTDLHLIFT